MNAPGRHPFVQVIWKSSFLRELCSLALVCVAVAFSFVQKPTVCFRFFCFHPAVSQGCTTSPATGAACGAAAATPGYPQSCRRMANQRKSLPRKRRRAGVAALMAV